MTQPDRKKTCSLLYTTGIVVMFLMTMQSIIAEDKTETAQRSSMKETGKPIVGVYYYPWYSGDDGQWKHVMRTHLKNPQTPKCGFYDSRDPNVIAEHIAQSVRGGISFWAVSWWGPNDQKDRTFKQNILTHPDASKLKYAVLYESTGRLGRLNNPNYSRWLSDLEYIKKTYFDDPRYLRIDNRPVLFVYLSRVYFRNRGQDALKQMREQFPEIYLVGDDVFFGDASAGDYKADWAKNFDAVTAYDVYGQSVGPLGGTHQAIAFLASNYRQAKTAANSVGTAFMPAIAPGYNDTAVRDGHPGRARYFTDDDHSKEGDIFRAMIRQAALPNMDSSCNNIIMITSFNEWYEDSQIEATAGTMPPSTSDDSESGAYYTGGQSYADYEYLYLDILRQETQLTP